MFGSFFQKPKNTKSKNSVKEKGTKLQILKSSAKVEGTSYYIPLKNVLTMEEREEYLKLHAETIANLAKQQQPKLYNSYTEAQQSLVSSRKVKGKSHGVIEVKFKVKTDTVNETNKLKRDIRPEEIMYAHSTYKENTKFEVIHSITHTNTHRI